MLTYPLKIIFSPRGLGGGKWRYCWYRGGYLWPPRYLYHGPDYHLPVAAYGSPAPAVAAPFPDVSEDDYYADAAAWAWENRLISGDAFGGDVPATRAATMTYLWKLAGQPNAGAAGFSDVPADADYATAVAWAVEEGITAGTGEDTFSPDSICTRAQIVTFLYQALAN